MKDIILSLNIYYSTLIILKQPHQLMLPHTGWMVRREETFLLFNSSQVVNEDAYLCDDQVSFCFFTVGSGGDQSCDVVKVVKWLYVSEL